MKFIMVGGFLGAGKTTALARLAQVYQDQGLKVGIVTNDQASDLVDTLNLRQQGLKVQEVAGACFCCQFDELVHCVGKLSQDELPDIILAEPVGSCTDLVATVVQPLKQLHGDAFQIAPYAVLLKPSHGLKILSGDAGSGFSPKAAYIFNKQLEEADVILINRIDELDSAKVDELASLVQKINSEVPIIKMSAKTGEGFDQYLELLEQDGHFGQRVLDLDYDIYAEGEAELGWLNSSVAVSADNEFDLDSLLMQIVTDLQTKLLAQQAEAAHLKTIGLWEGFFGVANLVSNDSDPVLSLPSNSKVRNVDVIVNARVAIDPEELETLVNDVVHTASAQHGATAEFRQTQRFRPGRPVPTHRIANPV